MTADTLKTREQHYKHIETYVKEAENLLKFMDGRVRFEEFLGRFFFSLRVTANDGVKKLPKKGYAGKIRSNLKCAILDKYRVDIQDASIFPNASKKWKSFVNQLVVKKRSEVEHHEEIDPITMACITELIVDAMDALVARGTASYMEKLTKIPIEWHGRLNYILQYGAQFILTLYEVRRGKEELELLKSSDFVTFEDSVFDFKYIR